ncbi:hypothetical protein POPTR_016G105600v4 [Populus trichocarpa]|nr:uncharacterized protein LOC7486541 [Populus trichocarpa]KAI5561158.1 hypothetical protein BDE02_16G095800 [Populus trichocarpa]PNS98947.1 hypothetical protein POPTR_016G105600v4 [Populus trichocarpa]|eukprot:XP_002323536.2 uncharacterized protein LOC7486541 [Populus trichocarpa]
MALHGSTFCYKVNFIATGDFKRLQCSWTDSFKRTHNISSPSLKKNTFLAGRLHFHKKLHIGGGTQSYAQPFRLFSLRACQVRSEDSEEVLSGESIVLDEQTLMRELQVAIEEENYAQAAKIRDGLKVLQEDSKASVLAANARFYNAFRKGDLAAMQSLWAKADNVCCVHPGASGIQGYDDVMESWELVWMNYDFPLEIELKNVRVHFRGDVGYVTCVEFVRTKGSSWGAQFVTNVFEKIDGQWLISIHHASPVDL